MEGREREKITIICRDSVPQQQISTVLEDTRSTDRQDYKAHKRNFKKHRQTPPKTNKQNKAPKNKTNPSSPLKQKTQPRKNKNTQNNNKTKKTKNTPKELAWNHVLPSPAKNPTMWAFQIGGLRSDQPQCKKQNSHFPCLALQKAIWKNDGFFFMSVTLH